MRWSAVLLVPAIAACDSGTDLGPLREPGLRTERTAYEVEYGARGWSVEIPYTFTNRTGAPVLVANCNGATPLRLDRFGETGWAPAWYPMLPLCLSDPIVIGVGATYETVLPFFAGYPGSGSHPQMESGPIDGVYRSARGSGAHEGAGDLIGLAHRVANPSALID
ncbi:MAG: hypothetical protein R3314_00435 [Longimicrobiales bacterium]|nr:hypothetical protein [Longimicrobiales bacterium]